MRSDAQLYIEEGILPGGFLTAVLENDMVGAAGRADNFNKERLLDYSAWLANDIPAAAWGSRDVVRQWAMNGGRNGLLEAAP